MSLQDKKTTRSMMKHAHTQYQLFKRDRERERETYLGRRGVGGALDWHDPRKGLSGTI